MHILRESRPICGRPSLKLCARKFRIFRISGFKSLNCELWGTVLVREYENECPSDRLRISLTGVTLRERAKKAEERLWT